MTNNGRRVLRLASNGALQKHHRCRGCGSWNVARSAFKSLVEPLLLVAFGRRPYRCLACGQRFLDRSVAARRR